MLSIQQIINQWNKQASKEYTMQLNSFYIQPHLSWGVHSRSALTLRPCWMSVHVRPCGILFEHLMDLSSSSMIFVLTASDDDIFMMAAVHFAPSIRVALWQTVLIAPTHHLVQPDDRVVAIETVLFTVEHNARATTTHLSADDVDNTSSVTARQPVVTDRTPGALMTYLHAAPQTPQSAPWQQSHIT